MALNCRSVSRTPCPAISSSLKKKYLNLFNFAKTVTLPDRGPGHNVMSFVIPRVFAELTQKIFHALRLEGRDRLQEILLRFAGLSPLNGSLAAGAGEAGEAVWCDESEVAGTLRTLEVRVMKPQLCGVPAPLTLAVKHPGGGQVVLSLLPAVQDVGVTPAQLATSRDISGRHEGDLFGGAGADQRVGETGVRHEGHHRVEIAGPSSLGHSAHTISLQDSVHVLHIPSRHPVQPQPGPDDGRDVPEHLRPHQSVSPVVSLPHLISFATSGWFCLIVQ